MHLFGDPNVRFSGIARTPVFDKTPSLNKKLGLFWGCQDIDPTLHGPCDFLEDSRGQHFYRSMAACKMRNIKSPFCRVCSHLMLERIRAAAV